MENFLNLAWAGLAAALVCLWLRFGRQDDCTRSHQCLALALLAAILFPVISVSDDLMTLQNAVEVDNYQRRDHLAASAPHPILPFAAVLPLFLSKWFSLGLARYCSPVVVADRVIEQAEFPALQNRPPPAF